MIHLCDLLLLELKATRAEEVVEKVNELTQKLVTIAKEQASHPLVVETYMLQSKLALVDFEVNKARSLMNEAKSLADEKGLQRLSQIVQNEIDALQRIREAIDAPTVRLDEIGFIIVSPVAPGR